MTIYAGRDVRLYVQGNALASLAAGVAPSMERELVQYAVMDSGQYHYLPALAKGELALEGLFDDNAQGILNTMFPTGGSTAYVMTVALGYTQGKRTLSAGAVYAPKYAWKSVVTDLNKLSATFQVSNNPWDSGVVHQTETALTTSGNGTAIDNAASSSAGCIGHFHYWNLAAGKALTVSIQHSNDNGGVDPYADVLAFTALDGSVASGAERKTAAGTIKRYTRVAWSFSGGAPYTATIVVAFTRS